MLVMICCCLFLQRALGLQLWASLCFEWWHSGMGWAPQSHAMVPVPVVPVCDSCVVSECLSPSCCCCWCFCMLDKGAVGSATDEWGICRHIVKYVWGLGIAQTCGHMWMYKIVQDLRTFAKWPVGRVSAQNVSSTRPCGREDVCREAFIEARWSTTFKIFQANFKLSSRSIPRYFKQVYDQQQQINSAGTLGSWREFTRSRACYLPDLCPWPQMFPLLISPATHFLYFCHFLAVGSVHIRTIASHCVFSRVDQTHPTCLWGPSCLPLRPAGIQRGVPTCCSQNRLKAGENGKI